MLFAIGLVVEFTIGGLSGVTHAVAPSDTQQTDTYYIVAHFHYVLFGGAVLGFFAGFYYWWPKVFGKCLNEKLGKWNFWLMVIGMNLTFGPMHILGLQGQPRRMYVWTEARAGEGFFNLGFWNLVASIGAFILALGVLLFLINVVHTTPQGAAGAARPVGRPHARVDDDEPAEGAQLRQPPDGARPRRVLPPQVRGRRRGRRARPAPGGHGRGDPRRAGGQRRPPHPHAVAVVLADRAGLRAADHRLRRDLQPAHRRRRRGDPVLGMFGWALEPSVAETPTTTRAADDDGPGTRWRPRPAVTEHERRRRRHARPRRRRPATAAPDLGTEEPGSRSSIIETIDEEVPMGGLPGPGPTPTSDDGDGAHAGSPTMPEHVADRDTHGGHATTTGLSNNKLAMWLFLGSECLLFGGLISTYMLYRGRHSGSLGPDQIYDIPFTSVSSFVLLMSSLTMVLAVSAVGRGDVRNAKLWLVVTALLGATFVGGQVYEFTSFYREGLGFTTSLFASSFYTLTGFHGVHVTVGIIMLLSLIGMISQQPGAGRQGRGRRARRPLLALRRHRLDRHLHPRLPDPGLTP